MRGLIWGCIYGGGAVVFGAILSHALSGKLTEKELGTLDIAAKYLFLCCNATIGSSSFKERMALAN